MRLNKRFILNAPKRKPYELNIELKKLNQLKLKKAIGIILDTGRNFIHGLKEALFNLWNATCVAMKNIFDYILNYQKYKEDDKILFSSLPSLRRFEKDMI